jgi:DNA-directed RNA polymerase subunit RPC12/RpoP
MGKSKAYDNWIRTLADNADKFEVESQVDAERADVAVCRLVTTPLLLPDNLVGHCTTCWRMIQFRPHIPKTPRRLCDECASKEMAKEKDTHFIVTDNTAREVTNYLRRKGSH